MKIVMRTRALLLLLYLVTCTTHPHTTHTQQQQQQLLIRWQREICAPASRLWWTATNKLCQILPSFWPLIQQAKGGGEGEAKKEKKNPFKGAIIMDCSQKKMHATHFTNFSSSSFFFSLVLLLIYTSASAGTTHMARSITSKHLHHHRRLRRQKW